ncbi:hypothetical protein BD779DRAFT_1476021 [Infundibulicybe gibba]|nr:hypothetical protein BD779DRAFT_1476021 [Infundibulicybe gibba]
MSHGTHIFKPIKRSDVGQTSLELAVRVRVLAHPICARMDLPPHCKPTRHLYGLRPGRPGRMAPRIDKSAIPQHRKTMGERGDRPAPQPTVHQFTLCPNAHPAAPHHPPPLQSDNAALVGSQWHSKIVRRRMVQAKRSGEAVASKSDKAMMALGGEKAAQGATGWCCGLQYASSLRVPAPATQPRP